MRSGILSKAVPYVLLHKDVQRHPLTFFALCDDCKVKGLLVA